MIRFILYVVLQMIGLSMVLIPGKSYNSTEKDKPYHKRREQALSIKEFTNHRWIYDGRDSDYTKYYKCSCCNHVVVAYRESEFDYKFCPYCGTELRR